MYVANNKEVFFLIILASSATYFVVIVDSKPDSSAEATTEAEDDMQDFINTKPPFIAENDTLFEAPYINRTTVELRCNITGYRCWAGSLIVPLCGNDNKTYLNAGVFRCAVKCDNSLRIEHFGPCSYDTKPIRLPAVLMTTTTSKPVHHSGPNRIRIRGWIRKFAQFLGFHVHLDGGIYLTDENKTKTWWNI